MAGRPTAGSRLAAGQDRKRLAHGFHHGSHDWRSFRRGNVGWAGPVFWPYAYDDLIDYTFWPAEYEATYDDPLWAYGYNDVFAGVLLPYGDAGSGYSGSGYAGTRHQRTERRGAAGRAEATSETPPTPELLARLCGAPDPDALALPVSRIARVVDPDSQQQAKLDALKEAETRAAEVLHAACPARAAASPLERLDLVELRLRAMLQAIDIVRPALEDFYASLNDEQKARFNQMGVPQQAGRKSVGYASTAAAPPACGVDAPAFPVDRVTQLVRPDETQRAALQDLAQAATQAADKVGAACPPQTPLTPTGRLDAVRNRVQAMLDATGIVRPALEKFYGSLDDAQKARFNQMTEQQARGG